MVTHRLRLSGDAIRAAANSTLPAGGQPPCGGGGSIQAAGLRALLAGPGSSTAILEAYLPGTEPTAGSTGRGIAPARNETGVAAPATGQQRPQTGGLY